METVAQTFTFQLDSEAADANGDGSFTTTLNPALALPPLARPRAACTNVSFENSIANVSAAKYGNHIVNLEWLSGIDEIGAYKYPVYSTAQLVVPDGVYSLASLELELNKLAYATGYPTTPNPNSTAAAPDRVKAGACNVEAGKTAPIDFHESELSLWDFVRRIAHYIKVDGSASETGLHRRQVVQGLQAPAKSTVATPVYATNQDGFGIEVPHNVTLAGHYGSIDELTFTAYQQIAEAVESLDDPRTAIPTITEPTDRGNQAVDVATFTPLIADHKIYLAQLNRQGKLFNLQNDPSTNQIRFICAHPAVKVAGGSTLFSRLLGFDVVETAIDPRLRVTNDTDPAATELLEEGVHNWGDTAKYPWRAEVHKPQDVVLKVRAGSRLKRDQQNPLFHPKNTSGGSIAKMGRGWASTKAARLVAVRALQIHVPSLMNSSYNRNGDLQGSLLATIPVTADLGGVVDWQPMIKTDVPCALNGQSITAIQWKATNEHGEALVMQNTFLSVGISISWPDPGTPAHGTAAAAMDIGDVDRLY